MRTKLLALAVLGLIAGGTTLAIGLTWNKAQADTPATTVAQADEAAGCCVTGDCCCPGQGACCDPSARVTTTAPTGVKKAAGCCVTGDCCCPGQGSCCATAASAKTEVKACCAEKVEKKGGCCGK